MTLVEQVEAAEAQLRDAMLVGDVKALDDLLADDLVFINQIGQYLTKADDLAAHCSGRLRITQLDISDQRVRAAETFPDNVVSIKRAAQTGATQTREL
jgi:ketosteroid isomerase-like protein